MEKNIELKMIDKKQVPDTEPDRQYYYMEIAKE